MTRRINRATTYSPSVNPQSTNATRTNNGAREASFGDFETRASATGHHLSDRTPTGSSRLASVRSRAPEGRDLHGPEMYDQALAPTMDALTANLAGTTLEEHVSSQALVYPPDQSYRANQGSDYSGLPPTYHDREVKGNSMYPQSLQQQNTAGSAPVRVSSPVPTNDQYSYGRGGGGSANVGFNLDNGSYNSVQRDSELYPRIYSLQTTQFPEGPQMGQHQPQLPIIVNRPPTGSASFYGAGGEDRSMECVRVSVTTTVYELRPVAEHDPRYPQAESQYREVPGMGQQSVYSGQSAMASTNDTDNRTEYRASGLRQGLAAHVPLPASPAPLQPYATHQQQRQRYEYPGQNVDRSQDYPRQWRQNNDPITNLRPEHRVNYLDPSFEGRRGGQDYSRNQLIDRNSRGNDYGGGGRNERGGGGYRGDWGHDYGDRQPPRSNYGNFDEGGDQMRYTESVNHDNYDSQSDGSGSSVDLADD